MSTRLADAADFDAIMGLYHQLQPNDPIVERQRLLQTFEIILNDPRLHIFVFEDQKILATCYLNIVPNLTRGTRSYAIIENVVTDNAVRNQGIGQQLMNYVLDFAWQQECYKVMLQTGAKREAVHQFYKSCGFTDQNKQAFIAWAPNYTKDR